MAFFDTSAFNNCFTNTQNTQESTTSSTTTSSIPSNPYITQTQTTAQEEALPVCFNSNTGVAFVDLVLNSRPIPGSNVVVEIIGKRGCGKTEILFAIVATKLVEMYTNSSKTATVPSATPILFFDLDCKLDPLRLLLLVRSKILSSNEIRAQDKSNDSFVDELVLRCAANLHIFQPQNSIHFLAILESVKQQIPQFRAVLLLIDSLSAFNNNNIFLDSLTANNSLSGQNDVFFSLKHILENNSSVSVIATKSNNRYCEAWSKVSERSERALWKTSMFAMKLAKWL